MDVLKTLTLLLISSHLVASNSECAAGTTDTKGACPKTAKSLSTPGMVLMQIGLQKRTGEHLVNKGGNGCTQATPCQACEGDCDKDQDCAAGLFCFQRDDDAKVPGCSKGGVGDIGHYDYCAVEEKGLSKLVNKGDHACTPTKPCNACEGDCDKDQDCAAGLLCFQRDAYTTVPGCARGGGGDKGGTDYCAPAKLQSSGTPSGTCTCPCEEAGSTSRSCSWAGDPHIKTFQGRWQDMTSSKKRFHFVHSEDLMVEGWSWSHGRMYALRLSGKVLGGNSITIYKWNTHEYIKWNTHEILPGTGKKTYLNGKVDIVADAAKKFTDAELTELRGRHKGDDAEEPFKSFFGKNTGEIIRIMLPGNIYVVTFRNPSTGWISMPPKAGQRGWCTNRAIEGMTHDASDVDLLQAPSPGSFKHVLAKCTNSLRQKAEKDCADVVEDHEKVNCIYDICATGDEKMGQETKVFEAMNIREEHGQVEEVGVGRCLDQDGKTYQGFEPTDGLCSDKRLKFYASTVKNVRGAESNGDSCKILFDSHINEVDGRGLVASVDKDPLTKCWKIY